MGIVLVVGLEEVRRHKLPVLLLVQRALEQKLYTKYLLSFPELSIGRMKKIVLGWKTYFVI
ncbi:MAG TPA: hypothetical protein VJB02_05220 [Coxiellaceae bacterium]|nr:hypothetical protein [Coxiellaceae bacterium]